MRNIFNSPFKVTQVFKNNPTYYSQFGLAGHEGLDLIPTGSDWSVLAAEDGVVVKDDDIAGSPLSDPYGKFVTLWHPSIKKATQYAHLTSNVVSLGQQVKKGEKIGTMGTTGNSSGAHVHLNLFDVDDNGVRLNVNNGFKGGTDPLPFLNEGGGTVANMYKGYDLSNPESMKVAVDVLVRVQNGEFVDKPKYDADIKAIQDKLTACENKPVNTQDSITLSEAKATFKKLHGLLG
jgi:murein DD-endopeptidase MepM/ murein hydrolase activator NlpD